MQKRVLTVVTCVLVMCLVALATPKKPTAKTATGRAGGPDKAYLQKIWDGWGSLDIDKQTQFYAQGPHVFFDVAPLKYTSWDEYKAGVAKELQDFKSAKFMVNDDAEIHPQGDMAWGSATVKMDATMKSGKREMATFRWTYIFEKQDGKWLLVHEHVSQPAQ